MEHDPVYSVIGGMIGYRTKGLPWKRQTRLRVMEFLFELTPYDLRTSLDVPAEEIRMWLNTHHPTWTAGPQEAPTPDDVVKQIVSLCQHYSAMMVNTLGHPRDYEDHPAIEHAVSELYESES
jgi:hypothetical protein